VQQHDGGRILVAGLTIKDFPAADGGVFICSHVNLFEAFDNRACLAICSAG
jgi:hypothetical protein